MTAYDPETHREPTPREQYDDAPYYRKGDRVALVGTDVFGTVRTQERLADPVRVLVDWDTPTDAGPSEWIDPDYIVRVAVLS
jgi:hypothetical protein